LGDEDEHIPYARGFEETFILAEGGGSHWADKSGVSPLSNMTYRNNGKVVAFLPEDFYSSKNYTDSLISFINRNREDKKPFFGYLSFTAPHDPLHAPKDYITKYKGKYDEGWGNLAKLRLKRLKELGIYSEDIDPYPGIPAVHDWETLTEEERAIYSRDMEVYAAMVDYMDMSIGRVLNYLEEIGEYDNTLIIFFSDNGANGIPPTAYPGNGDGEYLGSFNNSLKNRGMPNSFIDMGPGWAQAASTPSRYFKSFTTQGGIHSPCIIKTPGEMKTAGQIKDKFMHVSDILPTIFEVAKVTYPETYNDKPLIQPYGKSALAYARGNAETIHNADHGQGWELFEMKAYIKGEWKILRLPAPFDNGNWALYNLTKDPGETDDLSDQYPDKKLELLEGWDNYAKTNKVYNHNGHFDSIYLKVSHSIKR
jgi:arylsulfatase